MKSHSSMTTIPNDVAYEILQTAYRHTSFPYCEDRHPHQQIHSPISISHVSRRWRELALSIPSLWSCIHFSQHTLQRGDSADLVKAYIRRSGQARLSIKFSCQVSQCNGCNCCQPANDMEEGSRCPCHAAWAALLQESARWKGCVVNSSSHIPLFAREMGGKTFPVLEFLYLPTLGGVRGMRPIQIVAPSLTQLRVSRHCAGSVLDSAPLDLFSKLTTIELNIFRYKQQTHSDRFISMLRIASATLEVLILRRGQFDPMSTSPASLGLMPTSFPRLTFLVLDAIVEYCEAAQSVVAALCRAAHALDRLHVVRYFPSSVHAYLHSGSLRFPSVRFLRYFILDPNDHGNFMPNHTDWNNFIPAFPRLEELQISGGEPTPMLHAAAAMDIAATTNNGSPAWPHLASLALFGAHETIAIRFVQQRARVGRPLSVVAYEGWLLIRTELIFADLNVSFVPLDRWPGNGDDSDRDWIEYWHIINGTSPFRPRPVLS